MAVGKEISRDMTFYTGGRLVRRLLVGALTVLEGGTPQFTSSEHGPDVCLAGSGN
jgi:hypothetical protein